MRHSDGLFREIGFDALGKIAFALLACVGSAGCIDTAAELGSPRGMAAQHPRLAPRPGVSPRGAIVAIKSMEGAPEEVTARFSQIFARVAESRDIATAAKEADAAYRIRGYLTAYPGGDGSTRYAYVWDVFERSGRRAQRLTDEIAAKAEGDAWAAVDERTLTAIAARGADDLAAFLSNTPEAIAAAANGESGASVAAASREAPAPAEGAAKPLGYAETK
jgi:hypothetical protein